MDTLYAELRGKFTIGYLSTTLTVEQLPIQGQSVFRVNFSSSRAPLILTRTMNPDMEVFWTSVPEGRQREAEGVGRLIEEHLKKQA